MARDGRVPPQRVAPPQAAQLLEEQPAGRIEQEDVDRAKAGLSFPSFAAPDTAHDVVGLVDSVDPILLCGSGHAALLLVVHASTCYRTVRSESSRALLECNPQRSGGSGGGFEALKSAAGGSSEGFEPVQSLAGGSGTTFEELEHLAGPSRTTFEPLESAAGPLRQGFEAPPIPRRTLRDAFRAGRMTCRSLRTGYRAGVQPQFTLDTPAPGSSARGL